MIEQQIKKDIQVGESTQNKSLGEGSSNIFGDKSYKTIFIAKKDKIPQSDFQRTFRQIRQEFSSQQIIKQYNNISKSVENIQRGTSISENHFFNSFYLAYALHGDLVLAPEDIWFHISSQFSKYFYENAEFFRSKVVSFEGKKQICVEDKDEAGAVAVEDPNFKWQLFTEKFQEAVIENTKGELAKHLINDFSDTNTVEKLSTTVCLMHAMEKFFEYQMASAMACGIPQVHMLGSREDWIKMIEKVQYLKQYKIEGNGGEYFINWIERLTGVLKNFLQTYDENPDLNWWMKSFDQSKSREVQAGSAGSYMHQTGFTGWIKDLFYMAGDITTEEYVDYFNLRNDTIKAPVLYVILDTDYKVDLNFLSGFTSTLCQDNQIFRPEISLGFAHSNK